MGKYNDLTGMKFGRLTVVSKGENAKDGHTRWWCKCDCGNPQLVLVQSNNLKCGGVKSCGCLNKEVIHKIFKKYNTYDLSGEYGIGYTLKGEEFWFDLEDYDKIKDYCWFYNAYGYVSAKNNDIHILLHRLVMGNPESIVDHINHNRKLEHQVDNRKQNLRLVSPSQNCMNTHLYNNNTSGYKGVKWNEHCGKWEADIQVNKKSIYLGVFDSLEDAVKVRQKAEEEYFGQYRYIDKVVSKYEEEM